MAHPKKSTSDFAIYVEEDLLGHLDGISIRGMFGGFGVYQNGLIFAMIVEDEVYMKTSEETEPRL